MRFTSEIFESETAKLAHYRLFRSMNVAVLCYVVAYIGIYLYLGARLTALLLTVTMLVQVPLLLWSIKNRKTLVSYYAAGIGPLLYILASAVGIRENIQIELYYLPALMLPGLLFHPYQRKHMLVCISGIPLAWVIQKISPFSTWDASWFPVNFPAAEFKYINFFGAVGITAAFVRFFVVRQSMILEALFYSQKQLEEAQRVAKLGSWEFDLATQGLTWSRQMFQLFDEEETRGPPTLERHRATIHAEDRSLWESTVERCIEEGKSYRIRFRSVFPDKILWVEALGSARLNQEGTVATLMGTCQDVSDLVLAEEARQLERNKAVQNAKLASLGEMAAGVAHEINNPLAIISGTLQLLPRILNDPEKRDAKLKGAARSVERIVKIISGLKKFSRQSHALEFSENSLKSIVEEGIDLTASKAKSKDVAVRFESETEGYVNCNEIEIEQVIVNLISNAVDAVDHLEVRWVELKLEECGSDVKLTVVDSGGGIAADVRGKLFEPFFTTKAVGSGTGLGLSISHAILKDHGATIEVDVSNPHTCFVVTFQKAQGLVDAA